MPDDAVAVAVCNRAAPEALHVPDNDELPPSISCCCEPPSSDVVVDGTAVGTHPSTSVDLCNKSAASAEHVRPERLATRGGALLQHECSVILHDAGASTGGAFGCVGVETIDLAPPRPQ